MTEGRSESTARRPLASWLALCGLAWAAIGLLEPAGPGSALVAPLLATAGFAASRRSRGALGRVHHLVPVAAWAFALCGLSDPELRADAPGYYAYLRSAFFDGDLDFLNEARAWGHDPAPLTATGLRENHYPVGPALIWAPFFLLAHAWVLLSGALGISEHAATGFTLPYYRATALGTLSVTLLGAELLRRVLAGAFPGRIAGAAVLATVLLSPILYYAFVVPTMAHALVFGVGGAACWALRRCETTGSRRAWIALGAAIGLLTLVRWQAVVFALAALPVAAAGLAKGTLRWGRVAAGAATSLAVFSPQLLAWQILYGTPVTVPQGAGFFLGAPSRAADVLIHSHHGFFTWTPGMLAASLGLVLALARPLRALAAGGWLVFAATVILNGSLVDWHGSDAFGSRRFDVVLPFLALGFAALFQACVRRPLVAVGAVVLALATWNVGMITLKRRSIITGGTPFEQVAGAQARLAYRSAEEALDRVAGAEGRGLAYKVFVGQYLYQHLLLDGRIDLADADPRFLASGWSAPRGRRSPFPFRLALHPEACLRLPLAGPADLRAVLTARAPAGLVPQAMSVLVNGRVVATRQLGAEWRDVAFTLPEEELQSGENALCFRFARRLPGEDGVAAAVARLQLP